MLPLCPSLSSPWAEPIEAATEGSFSSSEKRFDRFCSLVEARLSQDPHRLSRPFASLYTYSISSETVKLVFLRSIWLSYEGLITPRYLHHEYNNSELLHTDDIRGTQRKLIAQTELIPRCEYLKRKSKVAYTGLNPWNIISTFMALVCTCSVFYLTVVCGNRWEMVWTKLGLWPYTTLWLVL